MNSTTPHDRISTYEDLLAERLRLEGMIHLQKKRILQDLDELKDEFKEELRPAVEAASFIKKITTKETRTNSLLQMGSTLLIDVLVRRVFSKSNMVIQLLVPNLVKNYSTHLLFSVMKKLEMKRQNGHTTLNRQ